MVNRNLPLALIVSATIMLPVNALSENARFYNVAIPSLGGNPIICIGQKGDGKEDYCYDPNKMASVSVMLAEIHRREQSVATTSNSLLQKIVTVIEANTAASTALQQTIASTYEKHKVELKQTIAAELIARIEALPVSLARNDEAYGELKRRLFDDIERSFGIEPQDDN